MADPAAHSALALHSLRFRETQKKKHTADFYIESEENLTFKFNMVTLMYIHTRKGLKSNITIKNNKQPC